jgi:hypothetical protein
VAAAALLAGTAAAEILLAVLARLGVAAVVVGIIGGLPGLFLGLAAVVIPLTPESGALGRRSARRWDPVDLGVHKVVGGGPLPQYVLRPHDELLWAVLDPAVAGSRLVVMKGESSTGKSRAAYRAVIGRLGKWRLYYPQTTGELGKLLEAGIAAHSVLWLGELHHYAGNSDWPDVLTRLMDLLAAHRQIVVITAVWPDDWRAWADSARKDGTVGVTGRVLARLPELAWKMPAEVDPCRGGVIEVPEQFTGDEIARAAEDGEPVLADAVAAAHAAGSPGRITQYLAGVPDLLEQYGGVGGSPYGQAVITAAIDAARLGHVGPIPANLLRDAAPGYLTDDQRAAGIANWWEEALRYATEKLKGAIMAISPIPPEKGMGVIGYRPADYLEQHGRRQRAEIIPPASFWAAACRHASPADQDALSVAARNRGLCRVAAQLAKNATAATGNAAIAARLIEWIHFRDHDSEAAQWAITTVTLDNPSAVADLLGNLRRVGDGRQHVAALLDHNPAASVFLDNPLAVARLLDCLRDTGASQQVTALAERAAPNATLDDANGLASLLRSLRLAGARQQVTAILDRNPAANTSLDSAYGVVNLLESLRQADARQQVTALAERAAASIALDDANGLASLLDSLRLADARQQVAALLDRNPAANTSLDSAYGVANLLDSLRKAGASQQVTALAERAAANVALDKPDAVAWVLYGLRLVGARQQVAALLDRNPAANAILDSPYGVASLLNGLRLADARQQVAALLDRNPAANAILDSAMGVADLLDRLREARASQQVAAFLDRDLAANTSLDNPYGVLTLLRSLRRAGADDQMAELRARLPSAGMFGADGFESNFRFGRELDGAQATPWGWNSLS